MAFRATKVLFRTTKMDGKSSVVRLQQPQRVAVIGAGPAGLAMAQQLLLANKLSPSSSSALFDVVVFERRKQVGGVWTYDPDPGPCIIRYDAGGKPYPLWAGSVKDGDQSGCFQPPGPMYDGLRTNLPCDIMTYRSKPYLASTNLFPTRQTVQDYIDDFAAETLQCATLSGELNVRFSTAVSSVLRTEHSEQAWGGGSKWAVTSTDIVQGTQVEEQFDKIVLASGRCNTPNIPFIPGLWSFQGTILHSAWWRSPIPFKGQTVLVVGNSSSGSDIARELAGYVLRTLPEGQSATDNWIESTKAGTAGTTVLHSYEDVSSAPPLDFDPRDEASPEWAKRIQVVPKVVKITRAAGTPDCVVQFDDGTQRSDIQSIVFGTGYSYDFPYLNQEAVPFDARPLVPHPPPCSRELSDQDLTHHFDRTATKPYTPSHRLAPFLTNLDDWSLLYRPDPSICVLGAPVRIIPFPITQIQSRFVAAFWSGRLDSQLKHGLPKLDTRISSTQPDRWTSWKREFTPLPETESEPNKTSDLGYPADTAYQNALLELLPNDMSVSGPDEHVSVPNRSGSSAGQEGDLDPVTVTNEGWRTMSAFRNERRVDTKRLRRRILGY